jgi:hypothetical protein
VSADSGYSESAAQRHLDHHLRPGVRLELSRATSELQLADFVQRLVELTDETAAVRSYAKQVNDPNLLLRAVAQETATLTVMMNRLGISDADTLDNVRQAHILAMAVSALLASSPAEATNRLTEELRARGGDDLADAYEARASRARAAGQIA